MEKYHHPSVRRTTRYHQKCLQKCLAPAALKESYRQKGDQKLCSDATREMCWRPAQTSRWQLGEKLSWWMSRPTKKPGGIRVGGSTKRSSLLLKRVPFKSFTVHHNPPVSTMYPVWIHVQFWIVQVVSGWDIWGGKGAGLQANHITTGRHQQVYCLVSGLCFGWGWCWWWWWSCDLPVFSCIPVGKDKAWLKTIFPPGGAGQGPRFILKWIRTYIIR
jgi:hypothetical protein